MRAPTKRSADADEQAAEMFSAMENAGDGPDTDIAGLMFYLTGGTRCSTPAAAVLSMVRETLDTALLATNDGDYNMLSPADLRRLVQMAHRGVRVSQELLRREHAAQRKASVEL